VVVQTTGVLRDQTGGWRTAADLLTVNLRYERPTSSKSQRLSTSVSNRFVSFGQAARDFRFAATDVTACGMLRRGYQETGAMDFDDVEGWAREASGGHCATERSDFVRLVDIAGDAQQAVDLYNPCR
jgi:hypothetical protein